MIEQAKMSTSMMTNAARTMRMSLSIAFQSVYLSLDSVDFIDSFKVVAHSQVGLQLQEL